EEEFSPCSIGGTSLNDIKQIANSELIISLGSSMEDLALTFAKEQGLSSYHFDSLSTLDDIDSFFELLRNCSGNEPKKRYLKQRSHLLDTLLDTQFYLSGKQFAIAGDPEFITKWKNPLEDIGAKATVVSSIKTEKFEAGDLGDLHNMLLEESVDFLIGSTHVADLAHELSIAVVRAGIPVSDRIGEPQSIRIGYLGAARLYMDCANAVMAGVKHTEPYISSLRATL
ncbi:MAG: hypothetical protein HQK84_07755, partial [Nitrospinae bacterium]|nr:hypothetical protein [Nitrospinota bacterium]